jgi:hypothetical protein
MSHLVMFMYKFLLCSLAHDLVVGVETDLSVTANSDRHIFCSLSLREEL